MSPKEPAGLLSTLRWLLKTRPPLERIGDKDEADPFLVSTVLTNDVGWETALIYEGMAYPVERYNSRDEAWIGHDNWIKRAPELDAIPKLGYGICPPEEIPIKRPQ